MGTHPIFESDFDCLTEKMNPFSDVEHPWSWMHREEIGCSSCPAQINPFDVFFTHPVMKTLQCEKCNEFYSNGLFTTDAEGYYEHCRWCADGGTLYGCDKCVESFCKQCVLRNLGRVGVTECEASGKWVCYVCDPSKVAKCVEFAQRVKKCVKLHDIALEEQQKKKEANRLKRQRVLAAQQRAKSKRSDGESTDEEEIERQLLGLVKVFEKMIEDEEVDHRTKRLVLAKLKKNDRKFNALKSEAEKRVNEAKPAKKARKPANDRKKKNLKIIESSENESEPEFKDNLASSDEDAPSTSKPKARVNLLSKKKGKKPAPKKKESSEDESSDGSSSGFD